LVVILALAVIFVPQDAVGQHPVVPKLTLSQVEQLVSSKVPDSTLSTQIQKRGLAFAPTPAIVESLRAKGAGSLTLAAIEEFFPEAPLAATMQFIQDKLSGLGNFSFTAFTQNTANGSNGNNTFTYKYSNVVADQNQCRVSFHANSTRDGSTMWDGNYGFSLRDVQEIVVKPYTQLQTEANASAGLPYEVCTSINPPMTALLLSLQNGAKQPFPFTDAALANRVAKAIRHAAKLCGSNNATFSGTSISVGRTPFFGVWNKVGFHGGYVKVIISGSPEKPRVHLWGAASPQDTDDGEEDAVWDGSALTATFQQVGPTVFRFTLDQNNNLQLNCHYVRSNGTGGNCVTMSYTR
jgi:hypothetical protein